MSQSNLRRALWICNHCGQRWGGEVFEGKLCGICGTGKLVATSAEAVGELAKLRATRKTQNNPPDTRGQRKAEICRSNRCGQYDEANDDCLLVIEIGKQKGQNRAGKISWLYSNPDAECPHDPPMWSGESNGDSMADGTGIA